jgi:O-methyltransferase
VLFDLPHVVATAPALPAERWHAEGGSFFERVPRGGDAYVLRAVLHDWADDECVRILAACRAAMRDDAALLVVERDLDDGWQETALSDVNMLVVQGGRERTASHYGALFEEAGFRLVGDTPTATGFHVLEGAPAAA